MSTRTSSIVTTTAIRQGRDHRARRSATRRPRRARSREAPIVRQSRRASVHEPEREHGEREEDERERRRQPVPVHRLEPDRRDGVGGRSEQPRSDSPQRADDRVDAERSQRRGDDDAGAERPGRGPVEDQKAPVHGADPGRIGEDAILLARERIVDQERVLRLDLVRVEQVVPPVGAARRERARDVPRRPRGRTRRHRRAPRPRCLLVRRRPRCRARSRPRRGPWRPPRPTTSASTASLIETSVSGMPTIETVVSRIANEPSPSAGRTASRSDGVPSAAGSSGSSEIPQAASRRNVAPGYGPPASRRMTASSARRAAAATLARGSRSSLTSSARDAPGARPPAPRGPTPGPPARAARRPRSRERQ